MKITKIMGRQLLDSRGNPTVEAELKAGKHHAFAMVPSGASTAIHEAKELRDGNKEFGGKSVHGAVLAINTVIAKRFTNKNVSSLSSFDKQLIDLDGTAQKNRLGENAILATSMAVSRLLAQQKKQSLYRFLASEFRTKSLMLPVPFANVINGGVHAGNALEMQEFMIAPVKAKTFSSATRIVAETYHALKTIIQQKYGKNATNVGDEGGFAPPLKKAEQALDLMNKAVEQVGYEKELRFAMDPASSEFYNAKRQKYLRKKYTADKLQTYYEKLIADYPLVSLEDPFEQDDFQAWKNFTADNKKKLQIVGDDLTVTNPARVQLAVDQKLCTALLLKINQIGTITES